MTIETERIYEISREQFYGVFQNAYPYTAVIRTIRSNIMPYCDYRVGKRIERSITTPSQI